MLSRLAQKGWLTRLRRGVYAVVPLGSTTAAPVSENPLAIAMQLFAPCYISGWTAAEHWGLTDQVSNAIAVYSATPQRSGTQSIGQVTYRVHRVPARAIFGTTRIWSRTVAVDIATIHRTLIDILDTPAMGGGGRQTIDCARAYWTAATADPDELLRLARRLEHGAVFKRLGFTAERLGHVEQRWLERCHANLSAGIALVDPQGPERGRTITRWRLRINVPVDAEP